MPIVWNVITLKEHFEAILLEKDKALAAALIAVKEENRKTEIAAEKRFELLNELRDGVATTEQLQAVQKEMGEIKDRLNRTEGKGIGMKDLWAIILGLIGLFFLLRSNNIL